MKVRARAARIKRAGRRVVGTALYRGERVTTPAVESMLTVN